MQLQVDSRYSNNSGRIVLITTSLNGQKVTLGNIYAPNDQANQLQFLQENDCIIDKTELTSLIVGGDWNCTLTKKDKMGGAPWKPTTYSNLISTTMELFDLIDIQRVRHPKLRKFTYESKSLRVKSRIDFFLIAKDLTVYMKKSEILPAIAPDDNAIFISLTLPNKSPRGPGFWKFNNTLLKDSQYIDKIHNTFTQARKYYGHLTDKRLFWEMIKMDIRSATITYSKNKSKSIRNRERELIRKLDHLDGTICNNCSSPHIDGVLREYDKLKTELQSIYEERGKQAIFRAKSRCVENGERQTKYFPWLAWNFKSFFFKYCRSVNPYANFFKSKSLSLTCFKIFFHRFSFLRKEIHLVIPKYLSYCEFLIAFIVHSINNVPDKYFTSFSVIISFLLWITVPTYIPQYRLYVVIMTKTRESQCHSFLSNFI